MAFADGDFVEIDYTASDAADGSVIATTSEQAAKSAGIYGKDMHYGPTLVVIGANAIVKGLERELRGMDVGQKKSFVLGPEDAFGNRDEQLVRVMPLSEFRTQKIDPYPGMRINLDNIAATVKSVGSGRVVVDANHPDAGKSIKYDVAVIRRLQTDKEKAEALCKTYDVTPTSVEVKGGELDMYFDNKVKKDADYFVNRASMMASAFAYLKGIEKIEVREEYLRSKPDEKQNATETEKSQE
ncbi:MAG: peptidylprolyl isomerase [Candidatus Marsarchaeota archaeon]|nr:peptidylprolyl isomerase [Candidatus Marsarchaeota archaeon]